MNQPIQALIVEDDLLTAATIEEALLGAGFSVSGIARTGDEALRIVEQHVVQVAIIDVRLASDPDGVATARALLQHQWMPLLYLTGHATDEVFDRAKATNPAAFLSKPFRPQELVQQVRLALHNAELPDPVSRAATETIYLPTEQGYVRVRQSEIQYLEAARNFTNLYLTADAQQRIMPSQKNTQPLILTGNLGYWSNHLSARQFHRLSKSLLVNLSHIDRVETQQVVLGSRAIELPGGARKALLTRLHIVRTR